MLYCTCYIKKMNTTFYSHVAIVFLCQTHLTLYYILTGMDVLSSHSPVVSQSAEDTSLNRIRYKHTNRRLPHAIIIGTISIHILLCVQYQFSTV